MIFGLIGLKGSGKSTAAKMLHFLHSNASLYHTYRNYKEVDVNNAHLNIFAFGDNLKDFIANIFNIPRSYFDDREYKEKLYNPCTGSFKDLKELKNGESIITLERAMVYASNNRFSFTLENLRNRPNFYIKLRTLLQVIGNDVCKSTFGNSIWIYPIINKIKNRDFSIVDGVRFKEEIKALEPLNTIFIKLINSKYSKSDDHISEIDISAYEQFEIQYDGNLETLFNKLKTIYNNATV